MKQRTKAKHHTTLQRRSPTHGARLAGFSPEEWDEWRDYTSLTTGEPPRIEERDGLRCIILPDDPLADALGKMLMQAILHHATTHNRGEENERWNPIRFRTTRAGHDANDYSARMRLVCSAASRPRKPCCG